MPTLERSVLVAVSLDTAYEAITDVERYPEFLPACESVTVLSKHGDVVRARVTVSGMGLRESFTTKNTNGEHEVSMELEDGPFDRLDGVWRFAAIGDSGCRVALHLDYRAEGMLAMVLSQAAPSVADKMVDAFVARMELL
jgi:ribosome-associated toxin RatA of RatAB toxin-antitoxin module